VLSPEQAAALVDQLVQENRSCTKSDAKNINFVVGVAGPGEPLANEATFEALKLVHRAYPELRKCVSTNGLLLEKKLRQLIKVGVSSLTVTVNAPDSQVGKHLYQWVQVDGKVNCGEGGVQFLLECQKNGIQAALAAGLRLKVNTVLVPDVNDQHVARLAEQLRDIGVQLMNIMPLIPSGRMRQFRAPTCQELRRYRLICEEYIPQFRACEQCSADVIRLFNNAVTQPEALSQN
jgi:nitrogen fixation protein NifB